MTHIKTEFAIIAALTNPTLSEFLDKCKETKLGESVITVTDTKMLQFYLEEEKKVLYYKLLIMSKQGREENILAFTKLSGMYRGGFDTYIRGGYKILGLL